METTPGTAVTVCTDATTSSSGSTSKQQTALVHMPVSSMMMMTSSSTAAAASAASASASPASSGSSMAYGGGAGAGSSSGGSSSNSVPGMERLSRPMAFDKMELLVREMQDPENGVPVRSQKLFLTSIPAAFMGYDLIEWMMEHLSIEESEALSIANQLCLHGYFFPVSDSKTLLVKDDSSLYRFQSPYYWPWQHRAPDNLEYAIYLAKRSLRNKQRHGLEEYESDALASLHKNLKAKWDFITLQADEQVRIAKDRKKGDKIVHDSQERAYWRVHRPPPGQFTPLEPCPIPSRDRQGRPRRRTIDDWQREVDYLRLSMGRTRMKMSQACECLAQYCETFADYDFYLQSVLPSNPWVTEDTSFWQLNGSLVEVPTEKRVRRWAVSIEELVSDATGLQEFTAYLKKEYSHENIRFWTAVNDLRRSAHSQIGGKVKEIYEEFLEPGAPCEINIDGKTMEKVQQGLRATPTSRFTFDSAAEHIYTLLLKKDCYPRFIRSEHYKALLVTGVQPPHKKRFFTFGVPKKKSSTSAQPSGGVAGLLSGVAGAQGGGGGGGSSAGGSGIGSLARRRGSDRSLSGSAHELAVCGVRDVSGGGSGAGGGGAGGTSGGGGSKVPHSHSQSNLSDIPYSSVVYRGDMPGASGFPILSATQEDPSSIIQSACQTTTRTGAAVVVGRGAAAVDGRRMSAVAVVGAATAVAAASATVVHSRSDAAKASVAESASASVCPWDDPPDPVETAASSAGNKLSVNVPTVMTSSSTSLHVSPATPSNVGAVPPACSDIADVSDRMRRSCGLRQSTVDCEMIGPKRLEPGASSTEHRRSSMSMMAPTLCDPKWASAQPTATIATTQQLPHQSASIDLRLDLPHINRCSSVDPADLISSVISEEPPQPQPPTTTSSSTTTSTAIASPPTMAAAAAVPSPPTVVLRCSATPSPIVSTAIATTQQASVGAQSPPSSTTFACTPTITVCCPPGTTVPQQHPRAVDSADDGGDAVAASAEDDNGDQAAELPPPSPKASNALMTAIATDEMSPTTDEYQECCAPEDFQMDGQPPPPPSPSLSSVAAVGSTISAEAGAGADDDDAADIDEDELAPGCVAPAPTPAPSIAPLAEIEGADADDEADEEEDPLLDDVEIGTPVARNGGGGRKGRGLMTAAEVSSSSSSLVGGQSLGEGGGGGVLLEARPGASVSRQQSRETPEGDGNEAAAGTTATAATTTTTTPNPVCPWEDEDVSATAEAPFVKTYATLGYL